MTRSRQVASFVVLGIALGCASEQKQAEPTMAPASYEAPPTTTNEPKSLPPQAPAPEDGQGTGPEGPGNQQDPGILQKQGPVASPPTVGGTGGMSGAGGMAATTGRGGKGGTRSIGE